MSKTAYSKTRPPSRPAPARPSQVDDYDDVQEPIRPRSQRKQYDEEYNEKYNEENEDYEDYDGYYADDEEVAVVSINRRAVALSVSAILVVAIFGVAIWLLMSRNSVQQPAEGRLTDIPTITGFNPATASEAQAPNKGSPAPDFEWPENGSSVSLSSYRGDKPVFVNFWATWCPPCKAEMPEIENIYNTHRNDLEIIGVSMGPRDWPQLVLDFVNKTTYSWKFIHDGDYGIATRYQVVSIPSSFFIDKNGVIQAIHVGQMDQSMMESYLQQIQ